jgi:hypothetical protein
MAVPFSKTFTPGSTLPSSVDVTLPLRVLSCASANRKEQQKINSNIFRIDNFLVEQLF